MHEDLWK